MCTEDRTRSDPQPPDSECDLKIGDLHARSSLIGLASAALWHKNDALQKVSDRALLIEVRDCVLEFVDELRERVAKLPSDTA